jgi:hypothetical protein
MGASNMGGFWCSEEVLNPVIIEYAGIEGGQKRMRAAEGVRETVPIHSHPCGS